MSTRARLGIVLGVLLTVGLGVFAWGLKSAADASADHRQDVTAWLESNRASLLRYSHLVDNERIWTSENSCAFVERAGANLDELMESWPKGPDGLLSNVLPSSREERKDSERRHEVVADYARVTKTALAQTAVDCAWAVALEDVYVTGDELWEAWRKLVDPYDNVGTLTCPSKEGCVPSDSARRAKYVKAGLKANAATAKDVALLTPETCGKTSLGPEHCAFLHDRNAAWNSAERKHIEWIGKISTSINNGELDRRAQAIDERWDTDTKAFKARTKKDFPQQAKDADVKKYPRWHARVLELLAIERFSDVPEASALEKLIPED